jgi:methylthioribose-1-phosphate isomerase
VRIEERDEREVLEVMGRRITPKGARAINYAFDVTSPNLVKGIITEKGIFAPTELYRLQPRAPELITGPHGSESPAHPTSP